MLHVLVLIMFTVTLGGWYQRTTLHLSEVYDLFALGRSQLDLAPETLKKLQQRLSLVSVTRQADNLEYILAKTADNIVIRYYEDGLYVLELVGKDIAATQTRLKKYLDQNFHPAISYIFSLGAPTPKELSNLKIDHPTVVLDPNPKEFLHHFSSKLYGEIYSQITSPDVSVYKTPRYIFVVSPKSYNATPLVEMQIFFREFKDQLERYLYLHRQIWDDISVIKEKRFIKGVEVEPIRGKLDAYQKTIGLINNRIAQMSTYINTRSSLARRLGLEEKLQTVFQYKFETLSNTHAYIKELWKMTSDYLNNAIQVVVEVKNQSAANSIQSLRLITTVGVLSGIIGYLSKDQFPTLTLIGFWYFVVLILVTWLINQIISYVYRHLRYELKFGKS